MIEVADNASLELVGSVSNTLGKLQAAMQQQQDILTDLLGLLQAYVDNQEQALKQLKKELEDENSSN